MSNEKIFINGIEYNDETQYSMNEEILRSKVTKLNQRIKQGNKTANILSKALIGSLAVCAILVLIVIVQTVRLNNTNEAHDQLYSTYNNIVHEYAELAVDYAQLKEDLENLNEIVESTNNDELVDLYSAINIKYSAFPGGFTYNSDIPLSEDIQRYAYTKCLESGIDYSVFLGLMRHESTFNPDAVSKSGDYGLCQINKCNHDWMKEVFGDDWDALNAYDSIDASTYILSHLVNSYSDIDTYHTLLMSYNMGHNGASKLFASGTYSSNYSRTIMGYAEDYGYTGNGKI